MVDMLSSSDSGSKLEVSWVAVQVKSREGMMQLKYE